MIPAASTGKMIAMLITTPFHMGGDEPAALAVGVALAQNQQTYDQQNDHMTIFPRRSSRNTRHYSHEHGCNRRLSQFPKLTARCGVLRRLCGKRHDQQRWWRLDGTSLFPWSVRE